MKTENNTIAVNIETLLYELFGFDVIEGIILDSDGNEFHGYAENDKWDLNTLEGIFKYHAHVNKIKGRNEIRNSLQGLLKREWEG